MKYCIRCQILSFAKVFTVVCNVSSRCEILHIAYHVHKSAMEFISLVFRNYLFNQRNALNFSATHEVLII